MNDKLSIIVPVYNVEDYLEECILSIINQTYKNLEIILVNDGSTDRSAVICDNWAKRDNRIKVVHKKNGGLSDARNAGLNIVTGNYVAFVDSDDYVDFTMYEKLYNSFNTGNTIGITSCQIYTMHEGERCILNEKWEISEPFILKGEDYAANKIQELSLHSACNKLYKVELLRNLRFRIGIKNEDTVFMYDLGKVMKKNNMNELILPDHLYYYRIRENSICTSKHGFLQISIFSNLILLLNESKTDNSGLQCLLENMVNQSAIHTTNMIFQLRERAEKSCTTTQLIELLYYYCQAQNNILHDTTNNHNAKVFELQKQHQAQIDMLSNERKVLSENYSRIQDVLNKTIQKNKRIQTQRSIWMVLSLIAFSTIIIMAIISI